MNHRVKNIFAITSALTTISARSTTTKDELVKDLRQRIFALSRAHDLVYAFGALCRHAIKNGARSHFSAEDPGRGEVSHGSGISRTRVGDQFHQVWRTFESQRRA
ncbi:HWE histidine kinase domain-containing protein [Bradyrhizobium elkanii]|uniref:HWE histidine kinase domain-containing protein n=1 Tax=Bradyrhizobium elkanii TaxID=29448 RepID=UPI0034E5C1E1